MEVGRNIKRLREEASLSRAELAEHTGVEETQLTRMEEQGEEGPVSLLLKIASIFRCDLHTLLYGAEVSTRKVLLTRREERKKVERRVHFDYESLAPSFPGRHMEPFMVDVYPAEKDREGCPVMEFSSHQGEEFHYVMEGTLRIRIGEDDHLLNPGDSIYFDSSLPHALTGEGGTSRVMVQVYNAVGGENLTRSRKMRELVEASRHLGGRDVVIIIPNETGLEAVNRAMEEQIVGRAYLVGDPEQVPEVYRFYKDRYQLIPVPRVDESSPGGELWEQQCAARAVQLVEQGYGHMLMKGKINTATFFKGVLKSSLAGDRRLSMVSIFELPGLDRLLFLTDPGINPLLTSGNDMESARDIILNSIDAAGSMGVTKPRVAILDANELPSSKIPSSLTAKQLSEMDWGDAVVEGPLSYDLALYEDSANHKGLGSNPVAGKADILVVPQISGGNFIYKAWGMTVGAEFANIVVGARVPLIVTSRSDSDMTKYLTLCASAVYSARTTKESDNKGEV